MSEDVSVEEVIDAPAELIYALVSDLPRMREWSPDATGGRWLRGGGPRRGGRFLGGSDFEGHHWKTLVTVTAAEPGQRFAFRVTAPLVPIANWEYRFALTRGGCRVTETWTDRRLPPVRWLSQLRTGIADRVPFNRHAMKETLRQLKVAAEAQD